MERMPLLKNTSGRGQWIAMPVIPSAERRRRHRRHAALARRAPVGLPARRQRDADAGHVAPGLEPPALDQGDLDHVMGALPGELRLGG
jgi:hypothetical protein